MGLSRPVMGLLLLPQKVFLGNKFRECEIRVFRTENVRETRDAHSNANEKYGSERSRGIVDRGKFRRIV